jgi:hypothetical protein
VWTKRFDHGLLTVTITTALLRLNFGVGPKKGSGTKSRHGPSGALHSWFLTPFSSATVDPKSKLSQSTSRYRGKCDRYLLNTAIVSTRLLPTHRKN